MNKLIAIFSRGEAMSFIAFALFSLMFFSACDISKGTSERSEVKADEVLQDKSQEQKATFYIKDGRLKDLNGDDFVMRGVNNPHAYFMTKSLEAIPRIKELGFNTVRIVWCADTLTRDGRCEQKDQHSLEELEKVLAELRAKNLVAVLNLQNATGSDEVEHLNALIDWYLKDDVKSVLTDYQDMLLINIANEWYGSWDESRTYVESYKGAISRLRGADLNHVLIIDARGYGQQFSSIPEYAAELLEADSNIMMAAHMYDQFDTAEKVKEAFTQIRDQNIPFVVGEFACDHYSYQPKVACDTIMQEASMKDQEFGYIAWSFSGNSQELDNLDVVTRSDWQTLSDWGEKLMTSDGGVQQTSKQASIFSRTPLAPRPNGNAVRNRDKTGVPESEVKDTPSFVDGYPVCVRGSASDPDGDGWGWENEASCKVL